MNASESRNRWSGLRREDVADGLGKAAYAADASGSAGSCEGALRMFFGSSDSGGECRTSDYAQVSKNLEQTCRINAHP